MMGQSLSLWIRGSAEERTTAAATANSSHPANNLGRRRLRRSSGLGRVWDERSLAKFGLDVSEGEGGGWHLRRGVGEELLQMTAQSRVLRITAAHELPHDLLALGCGLSMSLNTASILLALAGHRPQALLSSSTNTTNATTTRFNFGTEEAREATLTGGSGGLDSLPLPLHAHLRAGEESSAPSLAAHEWEEDVHARVHLLGRDSEEGREVGLLGQDSLAPDGGHRDRGGGGGCRRWRRRLLGALPGRLGLLGLGGLVAGSSLLLR